MKRCPSCGVTKNLETDYYRKKRPDGTLGHHSSCKECIKVRERKRRARECISCKSTYFHTGSAASRRKLCDTCSSAGRWCKRCEQLKPDSEFYDRKSGGGNQYCKPCASSWNRELRYGITDEEFKQYGSACGACGRTDRRLVVDHCHSTGVVRGLLCGPCNSGMGMFKDDINALLGAITYLTRHARELRATT